MAPMRLKGSILLAMPKPRIEDAEMSSCNRLN
jgi:hypothetical protein